MNREERSFGEFRNALVLLLLINFVLAGLKLYLGYEIHSSALRSDGWNNAADFVYSLLMAAGVWISSQPPDDTHPEGHARFESLVGLVVSLVIFGTGLYVVRDAYYAFVRPVDITLNSWALGLVLASIIVKGITGWFLLREGRRLDSSALSAIGWDQSGDVLADAAVVAAMGTAVLELHWIDPLVAGLIGFTIIYIGLEPFLQNLRGLTGGAPSRNLRQEVEDRVRQHEELIGMTSLRAHHVGPSLHVSITVKAPADMTLGNLHDLEEELRDELLEIPKVSRVFIHIEPPEADSPN